MSRCQCCGTKEECRCYPDPEWNDWWVSERTKLDDLLEAARRRTAVALWLAEGLARDNARLRDLSFDGAECMTFGDLRRILDGFDAAQLDRRERIAALEAAYRAKDEAISAARRKISELITECGCKPGDFCESFGCGTLLRVDAALAAGDYEREGKPT